MTTLEYIADRFKLDLNQKLLPIEIPNTDRNTLADLFAELQFTLGAEIGVEEGVYSEILLNANHRLRLYCIDAWTAYQGYREHVTQSKVDGILETAKRRLYGKNAEIMKGFSTDIVHQFADNSLDFVYIDGNHEFSHVANDITVWSRKVKSGGIVAGHDFIRRKGDSYNIGVIPAVMGYIDAYRVRPLFVLGRKDKIEGELRDRSRSWFFVKP